MANAIMIALGKAKKKGDEEPADDAGSDEGDSEDIAVDEDEVAAAKAVRSAKSDDEYAKALKAFIQICGGY